jgi:glutaredoxin
MADKELVVYARKSYSRFQEKAYTVLAQLGVPYREILIDNDPEAAERVESWTGFQSVPTLVVTRPGENMPAHDPAPVLEPAARGLDRGSLISEPYEDELRCWLERNGFTIRQVA